MGCASAAKEAFLRSQYERLSGQSIRTARRSSSSRRHRSRPDSSTSPWIVATRRQRRTAPKASLRPDPIEQSLFDNRIGTARGAHVQMAGVPKMSIQTKGTQIMKHSINRGHESDQQDMDLSRLEGIEHVSAEHRDTHERAASRWTRQWAARRVKRYRRICLSATTPTWPWCGGAGYPPYAGAQGYSAQLHICPSSEVWGRGSWFDKAQGLPKPGKSYVINTEMTGYDPQVLVNALVEWLRDHHGHAGTPCHPSGIVGGGYAQGHTFHDTHYYVVVVVPDMRAMDEPMYDDHVFRTRVVRQGLAAVELIDPVTGEVLESVLVPVSEDFGRKQFGRCSFDGAGASEWIASEPPCTVSRTDTGGGARQGSEQERGAGIPANC